MHGVFTSVLAALLLLLLAVTWADHHHQEEELEDQLSAHHADFAFSLYKKLNTKTAAGKNVFLSPLGISAVLSMLSTGARGETHSQLFSSLGYSAFNQTQVNEAYKGLFHRLGHSQGDERLDVGNAVALRSDFTPVETFLNDVRNYYAGEIFNVTMTRPDEAVAEINRFIANKTQDKIKDVVKELDSDFAIALINYVYFKGQWMIPFNHDRTHKADFHVDENTKVRVDMMTRMGPYKIYRDYQNHATVVMLAYEGNTSMMIVLPDIGKMAGVENNLNKNSIKHWQDSVSYRHVNLHMPKFSISFDTSLIDTLNEMGITNAFEDHADFSGVSEASQLKVSKVTHKATLNVAETGTEAAAVSVVELTTRSGPSYVITVRMNKPFLVFILENSTGNILFMGKINNPTAM